MKLEELRQVLDKEGVDPSSYDFDESRRDEVYCLERDADSWVYYYRERGIRRGETRFGSESEACRHVLDLILKDSWTRLPRKQ